MKFGQTIKMFLIDGNSDGRLTCELSNWTGLAYRIPRTEVKKCNDRPNLNSTGIYMLFGRNEEDEEAVYIGEAEEVYNRLQDHLREKDFWNEVIVFISKDENLNKAHIKYLENKLYHKAKKANRYKIVNGNIPPMPSISEADRAEMNTFSENVEMLVNMLGHKLFSEVQKNIDTENENVLYLKSSRGADSTGVQTSEGFVVFKNSKIASEVVNSFSERLKVKRKELIDSNKVQIIDGEYIVIEDLLFSSPSLAADIVTGRSANGLVEWKNKHGVILKNLS
ncbi:methionine sulfoxide reductase [Exiguobacterium sp. U13-1]|uniref:GIY-YIG nuclease family protein n=1 Tax=Exiguobacterium acetylicum TaxID=41170 RepID=A0ABX8G7W5_EXIAC|nr:MULTISPECIES: GIY-YIG nuclease family protein [Exiguobacterium]AOT01546.1 methionine sulfoxide reductase [Exiguobacterium sp. U13-1]QWB29501.1 GIY-YIG nuclease family protein [Exiguobacterium acetylicum]